MQFTQLALLGAWLIAPEPAFDERGSYTRIYCEREFADHGVETNFPQRAISSNLRAGTVRGMHFNAPPHEEAKVVSCVRGALFDVIIDLRPYSATFRQIATVELTEENAIRLYVPRGFAHGYQTLQDSTNVMYLSSDFYAPQAARAVRYDDPTFAIPWPLPVSAISDKDRFAPSFRDAMISLPPSPTKPATRRRVRP